MKFRSTTVLKIALILVIAGILLFGTAVALAGGDLRKFSTVEEYMEKNYTVNAAKISSLVVSDIDNGINIQPSPDDEIRITYYENRKKSYDINISASGELSVICRSDMKWYDYIGIFNSDWYNTTVTILIPESLSAEVKLNTSNGRIDVENVNVDKFYAKTSNGSINLESVYIDGPVSLTSNNGRVSVNNTSSAGHFEIDTSNGAIKVENLTAGGKISADNKNGSINFQNVKADGAVLIKSSNGALIAKNTVANGNFEMNVSNGRIEIERIVGYDITLRSSNGSIKGTVIGSTAEYSVVARASNGSVSAPSSSNGEKVLDIKTSNGAIKVEFEQ